MVATTLNETINLQVRKVTEQRVMGPKLTESVQDIMLFPSPVNPIILRFFAWWLGQGVQFDSFRDISLVCVFRNPSANLRDIDML